VVGEANDDGSVSSADARLITRMTVTGIEFLDWQMLSADYDDNQKVSTSDVRAMLIDLTK